MPESKSLSVIWTDRALQNAISIRKYIESDFSEKEVESFYLLLNAFEEAVSVFPRLYPQTSKKKGIRRAVLSKVLSVFYRASKNSIEVLAVMDNRCDISGW
jgi:plasmid stabilization system protein ParE